MKEQIPILVATKNTPEMTFFSINSCFEYNPENDLLFFVGSSIEEEIKSINKKLKTVKGLKVNFSLVDEKLYFHGDIINHIYKNHIKENYDKFILMDNDIYFKDYHYINEMLKELKKENIFCVADNFKETGYYYFQKGYNFKDQHSVFQKRIEPFFSLWRNDDAFKKAFNFLNFNLVWQKEDAESYKFYDTVSAICNLLIFMDKKFSILKQEKFIHFGGMTNIVDKKRYDEEKIIQDGLKKIIKFM